jgi:UDP-N-acetylglucosamine transferase subunit ALG13
MIFATVGTNEAPFDRLLEALNAIGRDEELVVQYGSSDVRPQHASRCFEFLPFDDLTEYVRRSRVVVMHAGVGSIAVALAAGTRPIVIPRLRRYREAVDDHQLHLARRMAEVGSVRLVEDTARLPGVVEDTSESATAHSLPRGRIVEDLKGYLDRVLDGAR